MRAGSSHPTVPLSRQPEVMAAIEAAITARGGSVRLACKNAGVSRNSFYAWREVRREPSVTKLVSLAREAGYEIVMAGHGRLIDLADVAAVMATLNAHRLRMRLSVLRLEEQTGIANRSYSYWLAGRRQPAVLSLSTVADALGFRLLMRVREDANDRRVVALAPAAAALAERLAMLSAVAASVVGTTRRHL